MQAIEYECDALTSIRRCDEATFPWGHAPAFWYIKRPMFTMDAAEIGWPRDTIKQCKEAGYSVAYWCGEDWGIHTPKKFDTPEDAYTEWAAKIRRVKA